MDISKAAINVLRALDVPDCLPEDQLPSDVAVSLIPYLEDMGMIQVRTIVPPGLEPDYPRGYVGYVTSSAGKEVLHKASEEKKSSCLRAIGKVLLELLVLVVGILVEHFGSVVELVKGVFR